MVAWCWSFWRAVPVTVKQALFHGRHLYCSDRNKRDSILWQASWTNIPSSPDIAIFIKIGVIVILAIILIVLLVWLLRSKKRRKAVVTVLLVGSFLLNGIQPVQADYSIPSNCSTIWWLYGYPECTYRYYGTILDALDGQHIVIDATTDGTNDTTAWPDGSFHIEWDATNTYNYYSDNGTIIVSTPCDRLFHEMYHVFEMLNHTFSRDLVTAVRLNKRSDGC